MQMCKLSIKDVDVQSFDQKLGFEWAEGEKEMDGGRVLVFI
jgi:hypothetical protein